MPKRQYPTLITWTDPNGKTHVPPDPPLTEGRPPWATAPNEYRRNEALRHCPALLCRRAGDCRSKLYGKFCRKTHMDAESFRAALANKIEKLLASRGVLPNSDPSNDGFEPPPRELYDALRKRGLQDDEDNLRAFQSQWIEAQKVKFSQSPTTHHQ